MGSVVTGPYLHFAGRGLPTALPVTVLANGNYGFAVMSGIVTWSRLHAGQELLTRQGISLELVRMSPCGSDHIFASPVEVRWLAYGL
jgi:hypothetical protein